MGKEIGFLGLAFFAFVGWLMFSSKGAKEMFLFYAWAAMLIMIAAQVFYYLFIK